MLQRSIVMLRLQPRMGSQSVGISIPVVVENLFADCYRPRSKKYQPRLTIHFDRFGYRVELGPRMIDQSPVTVSFVSSVNAANKLQEILFWLILIISMTVY